MFFLVSRLLNSVGLFQGCYTSAKDYLKEQSNIILGIGFSFLVFLVSVLSILLTQSFHSPYNFELLCHEELKMES